MADDYFEFALRSLITLTKIRLHHKVLRFDQNNPNLKYLGYLEILQAFVYLRLN